MIFPHFMFRLCRWTLSTWQAAAWLFSRLEIQAAQRCLVRGSQEATQQAAGGVRMHGANSDVKRCHTQQVATAKHTIILSLLPCGGQSLVRHT